MSKIATLDDYFYRGKLVFPYAGEVAEWPNAAVC
jgi:hypothetical protein